MKGKRGFGKFGGSNRGSNAFRGRGSNAFRLRGSNTFRGRGSNSFRQRNISYRDYYPSRRRSVTRDISRTLSKTAKYFMDRPILTAGLIGSGIILYNKKEVLNTLCSDKQTK